MTARGFFPDPGPQGPPAFVSPLRADDLAAALAEPQGDKVGLVQWFHLDDYEQAERALADLHALGVRHLRTGISWADWFTPRAQAWYDWLLPRLARTAQLLPCLTYTPPSLGLRPATNSPPRTPKHYADFLDVVVGRYGRLFEWVELWNEPNNLSEWDWTLDAQWQTFSEMIGGAAYWARQLGKKTLLGGMSPVDPHWLELMFDRGVMQYIDAVGIHGFPGVFEAAWPGWLEQIRRTGEVLERRNSPARIWITEAGYSTWRHEERRQVREFLDMASAPVDRAYWYSLYDLPQTLPTVDGFQSDIREYHFGLKSACGRDKLLGRLWQGRWDARLVGAILEPTPGAAPARERAVLITGGAGFIGTNLARRQLAQGRRVIVYDNLSRSGVERNLRWLMDTYGRAVEPVVADIRDPHALRRCAERADQVFHLAAQVAVTTSLADPIEDFEINVRGTMNVLEAVRRCQEPPTLLMTSTNKVYGDLEDLDFHPNGSRYVAGDERIRGGGIGEDRPLDFHSPYGCSKGAADQYVLDYARSFGLRTTVFRMSCIYGPHQLGTEDQGWVAHFLIRAIQRKRITLYGDGMQVRDILFVEDLVEAMCLAQAQIDRLSGRAFNLGGGCENTISLLELLDMIQLLTGRRPRVAFDQWRVGDQRYYVSDSSRFRQAAGWAPKVGVVEGVARLYEWLIASGTASAPARTAETILLPPPQTLSPTAKLGSMDMTA